MQAWISTHFLSIGCLRTLQAATHLASRYKFEKEEEEEKEINILS
jgi:hypothetical protein